MPLMLSGVNLTHSIADEVGQARRLNVYELVGGGIVTFHTPSFVEKYVDAVAYCCLRPPCLPDCRFSVLTGRVEKGGAVALRPIACADLRYQLNRATPRGD